MKQVAGIRVGLWIAVLPLIWGCSQNIDKLDGKNPPPPPPRLNSQMAQAPAEPPEGQPAAMPRGLSANDLASPTDQGTPPGISGVVTLDANLESKVAPTAVLYIIARDPDGGPLAVKRVASPVFPVKFFLGQESCMIQGTELKGPVTLLARLAQSGSAGMAVPGDLEGLPAKNPVTVGAENVELCIDQVK